LLGDFHVNFCCAHSFIPLLTIGWCHLGGGTYQQHCWAYLSSIRQKQLEMMVEMRLPMAAAAVDDDGIFNNIF
jgi:hypothetical protein